LLRKGVSLPVNDREYPGTELELFEEARRWKRYFGSFLHGYLQGRVLEVGAGRGGTTLILCDGKQDSWVCLEPDETLAEVIQGRIGRGVLPACCRAQKGTLDDLDPEIRFDLILYVDVLEHIPEDRRELEKAAGFLRERGNLVVIAPAHERLKSLFDLHVGHYRRYSKETIKKITPAPMDIVSLHYLDSIGFVCSLFNRHILRREKPTRGQILFWDKCLVPLSGYLDPLLQYALGRSLLAVWRKRSS
jgi:SAM-dependent methyltransferase